MSVHRSGIMLGAIALLAVVVGVPSWWLWPAGAPFVVAVAVLLGLVLWVGLEILVPSCPRLPRLTGEYRVGRVERRLRSSTVRSALVFYPTRGQTQPVTYLDDERALVRMLGVPRWLVDHLTRLVIPVQRDAGPVAVQHPWIIYIHGGMGLPEEQTTLCAELASQGYPVLAPRLALDPARLGLASVDSEDELVRVLAQLESREFPMLVDALYQAVLSRRDWPTGALTRTRGLFVVGHSLGGGLAGSLAARLHAAGYDVKGWINLDGHVLPSTPDVPQIHLSQGVRFVPGDARSPAAVDYEQRIRRACAATEQRCAWFRFPRAGHASFTDLPYLLRPVGPLAALVGRDRRVPARVRRLVLEFIAAPSARRPAPPMAEVIYSA